MNGLQLTQATAIQLTRILGVSVLIGSVRLAYHVRKPAKTIDDWAKIATFGINLALAVVLLRGMGAGAGDEAAP